MRALPNLAGILGFGLAGLLASAQPREENLRPNPEVLNLGFEAGDTPVGWKTAGEGYGFAVVSDEKHSGERSLRLTYDAGDSFGLVASYLTAAPARGKRVQLSGYLRTAGVSRGWAGLWIRADDRAGSLAYEGMGERGVTGDTRWTRYEVAIDVPDDAEVVRFGAILNGNGALWVDSLVFELGAPAGPPAVTVRGMVQDPAGRPLASAHVAAVGVLAMNASAHAHSGEDGRFDLTVPAGRYALTATARGFAAAFQRAATYGPGTSAPAPVLTLGERGITLSGGVRTEAGAPLADVLVYAFYPGFSAGNLYYTTTDAAGRFVLGLPPGAKGLAISSDEYRARKLPVAGDADQTFDVVATRRLPAPEAVVDWIRRTAVPLETAAPGAGLEDLGALAGMVGEARVVGIGEATHGTREFFQLRHRLLELLVDKDFTVFAVEAGWSESLAVNDYVLHGRGDPAAALAGLYVWPVRVEEMLAIVEWMRRYNADAAHPRKLKFYGIDMQFTPAAAAAAIAYLREVDPEIAEPFAARVEPLTELRASARFTALTPVEQGLLIRGLEATIALFDIERERWIELTGQRRWEEARQHVVILMEAVSIFQKPRDGFRLRDEWMSANLAWILDHEPAGTRVLLAAHNGHLTRETQPDFRPLGWYLHQSLGDGGYFVFGGVFHQGSFQAFDESRLGPERRVRQITVGPPPSDHLGAALARAGLPILALDLRAAAPEEVAAWFRGLQPMRHIGAVVTDESSMSVTLYPRFSFDALLFVETTSRARPLHPELPKERSSSTP